MPTPPSRPPAKRPTAGHSRVRLILGPRTRPWMLYLLVAAGAALFALFVAGAYFWVSYARIIDARLAGDQRPVPRIFGRPLEVSQGQGMTPVQLAQQLNEVGYAQREKAEGPGEFTVAAAAVSVVTRATAPAQPQRVQVSFSRGPAPSITRIVVGQAPAKTVDPFIIDTPLLAALAPGERRRYVPLSNIPQHVVDAVLAIEDRRFFAHPGVDPIGIVRAIVTNLRGDKPYLVGGSTLTQQVVKNTFLTPEKTPIRKLQEQFMALVLESRFTKQQILELYLNDVVLGRRGPFDIHGVSEAARIFFGKDVRNVTLAEAATMAGIIQSPSALSPFRNAERAKDRRNVVLQEMGDGGYVPMADAKRAMAEPLVVSTRSIENEAPYFVDYVAQLVEQDYAGLLKKDAAVDVFTTLNVSLQRMAQESLGEGIVAVDKLLLARKRKGVAQAALVALDPKTGEILAMVGGRGYSQSQFNRAVTAKRQPGSTFKPFVYLAAFEKVAEDGGSAFTPATLVADEPTTFLDGEKEYSPTNYQGEYDGPVTIRRALAHSRNIVAVKVAEATGYGRVADLWQTITGSDTAKAYPSIALGVFEASPLEMAGAYTIFANDGKVMPARAISQIRENGVSTRLKSAAPRAVTRPETTFLVTNMMRSVLNEGTGAGARTAGFTLDAAGKSGTTNDLRDAWFAGLTPDLLTVVWVGFDNNTPIGLSGSQAALPIWTSFMKRATAGRPSTAFSVPDNVVFVDIDKDTGQLATPECPKTMREAFVAGTEPHTRCETHGGGEGVLDAVGGFFRRLIR